MECGSWGGRCGSLKFRVWGVEIDDGDGDGDRKTGDWVLVVEVGGWL